MINTPTPPACLGQVRMGTVLCPDLDRACAAYCDFLRMRVSWQGRLTAGLAAQWGAGALVEARVAVLESDSGSAWLRLVEDIACTPRDALRSHGWMSMEVLVADVEGLSASLADSPFEMLGPPACLDISDAICAMQVRGPAGEILYLTEVRDEVPPFELPRACTDVDKLFIPVVSVPERSAAVAFYEGLAGREALQFDTKLTVVNQAAGLPVDTRHPVATLQLPGLSLIEIDQLEVPHAQETKESSLPSALAMISFAASGLEDALADNGLTVLRNEEPPYQGRPSVLLRGAAGELVELIEFA